ncbi:MAG: oligosaccharide flippase family protein [Oscillospiraceae bacterium]|nr:oligosaccharide flippase family protein [Oscillospiraceae bacterium]
MSGNSRTKNTARNLTVSFAAMLPTYLMQFVIRTIFVRILGRSYLGINGYFSSILTMLSLTELGLDTAINFKLYKPLAERDVPRLRILMKFYRLAYLVVGTVILILGVCLIPFLPTLVKDYDAITELGVNGTAIFLLNLGSSVTSYWFFASNSAIIKADQKNYIISITGVITEFICAVVQVAVLLIWSNFTLYVTAAVFAKIIGNLINAVIALRMYPDVFEKTDEHMDAAEIRGMFKDLGAIFFSKLNSVAIKATDNLVLGFFSGFDILGSYSNYLVIYGAATSIPNKAYTAAKASMGNLFASSDDLTKYRFFKVANYLIIIIYGVFAVGVSVLADELITVWLGAEYVIPQPFSLLVGLEILFVGVINNLNQIRNVSGLFRQMWFRPAIGVVINLVVSVALVQVWDIYGVLLGTIASYVFSNFLIDPPIIYRLAFHGLKPVSDYYIRNSIYFALLFAVGVLDRMICASFFAGHGWFSFGVHAIICGISVPAAFAVVFRKTEEFGYVYQAGLRVLRKKHVGKSE